MTKYSYSILMLLLSFSLVQAQSIKDPKQAKNPAEMELIFQQNAQAQKKLVQTKAAALNIPLKEVLKRLNIDVKFITGDDAKLNALISSGDMPDIVTLMQKDTPAGNKADKWAYSLN